MFKSTLQQIRQKEPNILDNSILVIIVLSAIIIGFETDEALFTRYHKFFYLFDIIIISIFLFELIIKMVAEGSKPWRYFYDPWNIFDFIIIMLSIIPLFIPKESSELEGILAFRLLRLARAFRAFRVFRLIKQLRPLQLIVETLLRSIPSIGYVLLMLGVWFYVYAILGVFLFGKHDPAEFGNLHTSLLTLFECATGNWISTMNTILQLNAESIPQFVHSSFVPIYFISFYFIGGMIILNLFIGIIVSELQTSKAEKEKEDIIEQFQDDLDIESNKILSDIQIKVDEINILFKSLQLSLDKDRAVNK